MIADVLEALVRANLATAAAVILVLLLRRPVRRAFGARAAYALWLTPPLAALAGLLPRPAAMTLIEPLTLEAAAGGARAAAALPGADLAAPVLVAAWLAGALIAATALARRQARFVAALGRLEPHGDVLRAEHPAIGPAVVGAFRPRIVTPADFEARYEPEERALILSHERVHLARGDGLVNAVAASVQCVCWFNPLVHVGVRTLRIDQELACDAAVLARHPLQRRLYAQALLKAQLMGPALPVGCHWQHPLKERIALLKAPLPARARRVAGLAVAGLASLVVAGAAWAVQPPPAPVPRVTQVTWLERPSVPQLVEVMPAVGVDGLALMACRVRRDGRLTGCQVVREAPLDAGLGAAALRLAPHFWMAAKSRDDIWAAGGEVRIPVRFVTP